MSLKCKKNNLYLIVNGEKESAKTKLYGSEPNLNKCVEKTTNVVFVNKKTAVDKIATTSTPQPAEKNTGAIPKLRKELTTIEHSGKILTGMDRYITITKRKTIQRSPTLEPNPKQYKNDAARENRFAILSNAENDSENAQSIKSPKPPPLFLREATTNVLVNKLIQLIGKENFHVVALRKGNVCETKVQINNESNYRKVIKKFDEEKKSYYTYQLKSAKGLSVIVKGIDSSVPTNEIKEALESEGYEVKSIHNILNKNKVPQPLFKVEIRFVASELKKKSDTHPIYGLRFLLNRKITVEEPHKRDGPLQCQNCQEYGHTRSYCKLPSVCARCGDIHKSLECPQPITGPKKCSNCGQNHSANYRGCPVFQRLKEISKTTKPVYAKYQSSVFPSLPNKPTTENESGTNTTTVQQPSYAQAVKRGPPAQQTIGNNAQSTSYAGVVKDGIPTPGINNQNSIENLIQTMNSFMANMQNMFQQLMQNQGMLMQILLNKK